MKNQGDTKKVFSKEEMVHAVNTAYHEEEAAIYDGQHPEIFRDEKDRWARIAEHIKVVRKSKKLPIRILDIGVGTGFVPNALKGVIHSEDEIVMADISPAMLDVAKKALSNLPGRKAYLNSQAEDLKFSDGYFDLITVNSVLHHIPNSNKVLKKMSKLLRSGGLLIIAHEPNILHFEHSVVGTVDRFLRMIKRIRYLKFGAATSSDFIFKVNARLLREGIISEVMTPEEIESLVDIHSPTAGRAVRAGRGFDPEHLANMVGFEITFIETYRHLGKAGPALLRVLGPIPSWLERRYPKVGSLFAVVMKKP